MCPIAEKLSASESDSSVFVTLPCLVGCVDAPAPKSVSSPPPVFFSGAAGAEST